MIGYFARHRTAANLLMLAILAAGILALPSLKRETFPDIPPDEVEIRIAYPGASAADVENALCRRIEDALDGVSGLAELRCEAREGLATAIAVMAPGHDLGRLLGDVRTEIDAIDDFPEQAEAPQVRQLGLTDFVAAIAITGPVDAPGLKAYAQGFKDRLRRIPALATVEIAGFADHQLRIELAAHTLRQYGLNAADIAARVGRQSVDLPAGTVETGAQDVLLRFRDERRSVAELADLIVVAGDSGAALRLGDIARITDRFESDDNKILFNGERAALLRIHKARDGDTLRAIAEIRAAVAAEQARAPPGMTLTVTQDVSTIVRDRLDMLTSNSVQGLVLVVLTLTLFLSFRLSFWVAMGLPVAFAGALAMMAALGLSLDMVSMVGLLIAIGVVVDDAIVIGENAAAHAARGAPPMDAAIAGTGEVARGVLASFGTTIAMFGPLAFLIGDIGNILKILPVVMILALSFSLIEAFCILPNHLGHSLGHGFGRPAGGRGAGHLAALRRRVDGGLAHMRTRWVEPGVAWAVRWRYLTVGLALLALLGSLAMIAGGALKFRVFPAVEGDVIEGRILMPQGTGLAETEAVAGRLTEALRRVDGALMPEEPARGSPIRNVTIEYGKNIDAYETGAHVATVSVDLRPAEQRAARSDEMLVGWRRAAGEVPGAIALNFAQFTPAPGGRAIDIRLYGEDLDALGAAARALKDWLAGYRGAVDLTDDLRPGKPEIRLHLRKSALSAGIDAGAVAAQLRAGYFGVTAREIQVGAEPYEVDVRLDRADRDSLGDLENFTVTGPGGALLPLGAVARLERGRGHARIHRIDGRRVVSVQGEVDFRIANAAEIIADTRARFLPTLASRFPGIEVAFEGQAREAAETAGSIRARFAMGVVAVFALLAFLFRSFLAPLSVMLAIPMGLVGVVWGHLALGFDLSMPSVVGFVALAGVVVNNGILMVTFIRREMAAGHDAAAAGPRAAGARFRAMMLTSLTTVMGLLPLLLETSLQAQVLQPLVASLAFGMIAATVIGLALVPSAYAILDDFGFARAPAGDAGGAAGLGGGAA